MSTTSAQAEPQVVWVPYADAKDAAAHLGPVPPGLALECYRADDDPWPASIDRVALYVLPYLRGTRVLDRVADMRGLRVVQTLTAGYEEFAALLPPGVTLCNAAGVHDASTAELAVALALASGRRLDAYARAQPAHRWARQPGLSLADRHVLVVGYGRIGEAIERRLAGFEVASVTRVARTARPGPPLVHGVDALADLLPHAEVVVLVAPLTPQTEGLVGRRELDLLPDDALVVNVGRGRLLDADALEAVATSGRLRFALDVTEPEPLPPTSPLWDLPNVLLSPHVGGASSAFQPRADALVRDQLARFAAGEELANVVVDGRRP